jgi:hypothetical protein
MKETFLAFSGGVESTTMALMFGHKAVPVFADTGFEHPEMYDRIERVEEILRGIHGPDFSIQRITNGTTLPAYIRDQRFYPSPMARFCTRMFKIEPMDAFLANRGECELMIGLNANERDRTGNHGLRPNVAYTYPLIDLNITREDCVSALREYGLEPRLPIYMRRGGCVGCFYKSKEELRAMVHLAREQIDGLIELEGAIQDRRGKHYSILANAGGPLAEFVAGEENTLFGPDDLYPEKIIQEHAPCGVFCHR